jgi:CBS domain-containing protein
MNVADQLARLKVEDVFNDSAKRQFLHVYPNTKLLEVVTFLAIGPEIYVDGVVVVDEENLDGKKIQTPVGMIGGRNVMRSMLENPFAGKKDFFGEITASEIMVEVTQSDLVYLESPLSKVIDTFRRTKFAFVPVISTTKEHSTPKPIIIGTLTIRDFLPLIANKKIQLNHDEPEGAIYQIASPTVSVNKDSSIREAINVMVDKGIRNIGIRDCEQDYEKEGHNEKRSVKEKSSKTLCIVNDRKIMEFLLSRKRREKSNPIFGSVSDLDIIQVHATKSHITMVEAARYLMDIKNPFMVLDGNEYIVTPWDLVMKTVGKGDL